MKKRILAGLAVCTFAFVACPVSIDADTGIIEPTVAQARPLPPPPPPHHMKGDWQRGKRDGREDGARDGFYDGYQGNSYGTNYRNNRVHGSARYKEAYHDAYALEYAKCFAEGKRHRGHRVCGG